MNPTGQDASIRVALDATPIVGLRTGIGECVRHTLAAVGELGIATQPFTLSYKARKSSEELPVNNKFIPIPARVLLRTWAYFGTPRIDHFLPVVDLVHATNYLSPPTKHPLLITVQDCTFARHPEFTTPTMRLYVKTLRRALKKGAWVHVTTEFSAREVHDLLGVPTEHIRCAPLGIPALPLPQPTKVIDGSPYLLAISSLEPRKNYPRLIHAFAEANLGDMRLVIAGADGADRANIDATIAKLPSSSANRIVLAGRVPDEQLAFLLTHALGLVYPSIYEGFGFPMLQAMQAEIPVLTSNTAALPEVAGNAATFVDPTDTTSITKGLETLVNDTSLRAQLIDKGKIRAAEFSWDTSARQLINIYEDMLA